MKDRKRLAVMLAGVLAVPLLGTPMLTAQVQNHVSFNLGLRTSGEPPYSSGMALSFGQWAPTHGSYFGYGSHGGYGDSYYHDDYYWDDHACWHLAHDPWLFDPFLDCPNFYLYSGFSFGWGYGWRSWHRPWDFFLGWPSPRYLAGWYGFGWRRKFGWGVPRYGWGRWGHWGGYSYDYLYSPYGYGTVSRYGYRDGRQARYVRSPLFGPSFKEDPRVYVSDRGPVRPSFRPDPDNARAGREQFIAVARPDGRVTDTEARRARPKPKSGGEARSSAPRLRPRPERVSPPPSTRPRTPAVRPDTRPTRPARPEVRSRPITPKTRIIPRPSSRTPTRVERPSVGPRRSPGVRPSPRQRSAPKVRPTTRRAPPRVRPAQRPTSPKAKPAPRRAPPRRRGG